MQRPDSLEEKTEATANEAELVVRLEMDRIALRRLFEQANEAFGSGGGRAAQRW